jgi:uncharacterized Zn-finger protein
MNTYRVGGTVEMAVVSCPNDKRAPGDIVGCGRTFVQVPDDEGFFDCPFCGLFFDNVRSHEPVTPRPGDVVMLDGPYWGAKPGARAVIDGHSGICDDDEVLICFGASAFRGGRNHNDPDVYVSCSGGPVPCVKLDELTPDGTTDREFWRWKTYPQAGGGEVYTATVNLWRWAGRPDGGA